MSPEEKELLKRTLAVAKENNEILRSIQRSMRLARFMSILYWLFILGVFAGIYYFIQPYIDFIMNLWQSISSGQILPTIGN